MVKQNQEKDVIAMSQFYGQLSYKVESNNCKVGEIDYVWNLNWFQRFDRGKFPYSVAVLLHPCSSSNGATLEISGPKSNILLHGSSRNIEAAEENIVVVSESDTNHGIPKINTTPRMLNKAENITFWVPKQIIESKWNIVFNKS